MKFNSYRSNSLKWYALLAAAGSVFALQAAEQLTPVATGLNSPRGLAFAPNGNLYVAEAGLGAGDGKGGFGVGVGFTGSITEIRGVGSKHPSARRIVTGLVSVGDTDNGFPETVGPDGVSVHGTGGIYVIMAESAPALQAEDPGLDPAAAVQLGHLLKVTPSGNWRAVADVGSLNYEWTEANKDAPWAPKGQFPDSNPYGVLALPGHQFVVDAGANTLNEVLADGSVRITAYFPNPLLPLPNGGPLIPISDSVPTCIAQGPDGFLYVGTLAFGANFARFAPSSPPSWAALPAQSVIYRVDPNGSKFFLDDSDIWASGLNPITGCAFGKDGLYVTEFSTQISHYSTGDVVKITWNPDGTAGSRTALGVGALTNPNGCVVGPDGSVYVSNKSISFGIGQVVRVNY